MRHHSVNGVLILRGDDVRVIYHVVRLLGFAGCAAAGFALVQAWTGRWRPGWTTVEALTLLSILDLAVWSLLYFWRAPRRSLYLRRRPVHTCRVCGYSLKGNIKGRCTECGEKNPAHYSRMIGRPLMRHAATVSRECPS